MKELDEQSIEATEEDVNNGHEGAGKERLSFTAQQQAKVQELIDDAYRKAYSKASKSTGRAGEVERLENEVERLREEKQKAVLYKSISKFNVVDVEEIAKLVGENIAFDTAGKSIVVDSGGGVMTDGSGGVMAVDKYIEGWLKERPHHMRSSVATGAGSRGAGFRTEPVNMNLSDPGAWRTMSRADLDRYLQEGITIPGASGQVYKFHDVKNPFLEARRRKFKTGSS